MTPLAQLADRLNTNKKLRLWSVIVTFFGDAVVPRGGKVSARTVQQVMTQMGFEEGAIRTAFSRLTADGWVERQKVGRSSYYQLSQTGAETFVDATRRIYAPRTDSGVTPKLWKVVFRKDDFTNPQFFPADPPPTSPDLNAEDHLVLRAEILEMPNWFKSHQLSPQYGEAFSQLMQDFRPVVDQTFGPLDALAVRCLLIHEWRRILLHLPEVHQLFQPEDWPEAECHGFVSSLYHALLQTSEQWMDENAEREDGNLPAPRIDLSQRFK